METGLTPSHNDANHLVLSTHMKKSTNRYRLRASIKVLFVFLSVSFYTTTFADTPSQSSKGLPLTGASIIGYGPAVITIRNGKIEAISKDSAGDNTDVIDLHGRYIVPAFIGYAEIPAINPEELEQLRKAGLDSDAILASATRTPAEYWGFEGFGTVVAGAPANLLVLDADPREDLSTLARPVNIYSDGVELDTGVSSTGDK